MLEAVTALERDLDARAGGNGLVLIGRRELRSNNSCMHNLPSLVAGRERCLLYVHPDDAAPRLFAFIAPGFLQLVQDGWQKSAAALEARQQVAEGEALADLGKRLAHRQAGSTLVRGARVFDSERAALGPASDVYVIDADSGAQVMRAPFRNMGITFLSPAPPGAVAR